MKLITYAATLAALAVATPAFAAGPPVPALGTTVQVSSQNTTPTVLGAVVAGQQYTLTTTGISDLFDTFNGGQGLTFTPDGIPTYTFPSPYGGFNPNGLNNDPTTGTLCAGGATTLCGALIGGFTTLLGGTPSTYLQLGSSYSFTAPTTGFLVGLVNDVGDYRDNGTEAFSVTLAAAGTPGAVPEPASWALMILGFGALGTAMRRRARVQAIAAA